MVIAVIGCGKKEASLPSPAPTAIPVPTATIPVEPSGETGTLSDIEGDVQVLRMGAIDWETAASGMKIGTGYSLKTGSDGYVLITFFDGSVMEVQSNSEISVEELNRTSGVSTIVHINQVIGNTINRVENLVDSSSTYEVETPAGSAVVRGTVYNVIVEQFGYIAHTCVNTVNQPDQEQHSVAFSNNGKTVNISESMSACCWEGGVPSDPFYSNPVDDPNQYNTGDGNGGNGARICDWTGTWCTDFGQMVLVQNGNQVTGCYSYSEEGCYYEGQLFGNVSGNVLTGMWGEQSECEYGEAGFTDSEEYGDLDFTIPDEYGDFEFAIEGDCNSFKGRWRYYEGDWEEGGWWSGTKGECPKDCRVCPEYDAELNNPGCQSSPQYIEGEFDAGGCRWYHVYLEAEHTYYFSMGCGTYGGGYLYGIPVMEIYRYSDPVCEEVVPGGTNEECGEGYGWGFSFPCDETGDYFLKVSEDEDDEDLNYTLAYYKFCAY